MSENQTSVRNKQIAEFIKNLSQLDDGDRARLKRNAGNSLAESHQVTLLFYQKIAPYGIKKWQEDRYFLIATLYPFDKLQREKDRKKDGPENDSENGDAATIKAATNTLGSSFRNARTEQNQTGLDRSFSRLLDTDKERLHFHLRRTILRLTNGWVFIDWKQLTEDVLRWHYTSRIVQQNWARDYVASKPENK
ncbi:MAG: type I-E CRISPR-associated protein Cse2/CasB [Chloroflexi bacterium]|nr:type I-E CRISPR-associated protein Cse2/CasB [Chloroflexota bacterium]